MFTVEQDIYRAEGVTVEDVAYIDNTGVITLIEAKRGGIFNILDEVRFSSPFA